MKSLFNKTFIYMLINTFFLVMFLLLNVAGFKLIMMILLGLYLIYFCCLNDQELITNQIIITLVTNVIYDMLWRKTSLNIPLEIKYLIDIISLILLLKIIIHYKKYMLILKDKIFIVICIFIVFSSIISFSNNITIINYFMSLRIYIRFFPIYIIVSNNKLIYTKYDLYLLLISNLCLIPIQMKISHFDDISGVFGISNVQTLLLFLIVITATIVVLYSKRKINIIQFILFIGIIFIICGIGEIKIGFVIIPIIILISLLLNTINPLKLLISVISIIIMVSVGITILTRISPDFVRFFEPDKIRQNVVNYIMKSNNPEYTLGRLENIIYSNNFILTYKTQKIVGLGVGSSMPPETYYFELPKHNRGRERFRLYLSELYRQYGPYFGYHFSSMNIIYLENGIIGIFILTIILFDVIISSLKLMFKSTCIMDKCISTSTIVLMFSLIGLLFYYNYILNRSAMIMIIFIIALNKNRIKQLNIK